MKRFLFQTLKQACIVIISVFMLACSWEQSTKHQNRELFATVEKDIQNKEVSVTRKAEPGHMRQIDIQAVQVMSKARKQWEKSKDKK